MARSDLGKLLKELDRVAGTTAINGPRRAAERIVRDLQERGPAWTGKFSNSWQIEGPDRIVRGSGQAGAAQPVIAPTVTGLQATRSIMTKNKLLFTISNFSPHAGIAIDEEPGIFVDPDPKKDPIKPVEKTGKRQKGIRGLLVGNGGNRRTAPLNWFTRYTKGGYADETIRIVMNNVVR
jgi:hypothetical protein